MRHCAFLFFSSFFVLFALHLQTWGSTDMPLRMSGSTGDAGVTGVGGAARQKLPRVNESGESSYEIHMRGMFQAALAMEMLDFELDADALEDEAGIGGVDGGPVTSNPGASAEGFGVSLLPSEHDLASLLTHPAFPLTAWEMEEPPHFVLLRSDGAAVACGEDRAGQCSIPDLADGVAYTDVCTGFGHTVLLTSDGNAVACGWNDHGECDVPALLDGVIYTQVAAGYDYTVLLKSDGTASACGRNRRGQCNIPTLPDGVFYERVATGVSHTVLLRSDGTAVACGSNRYGKCDIPVLGEGVVYTHVAAGGSHSVLLKCDGTAAVCGDNSDGQCNIPALPDGITYVEVAIGLTVTVLLRSDGIAVACGSNSLGHCNIPALAEGVTYTQVAVNYARTVLLKSDGNAVACGMSERGECNIPALAEGVTYVRRGAQTVLTLNLCDSYATFCSLSGDEVCRVEIDASDRFIDIRKAFMNKMNAAHGKFSIVLPSGELLGAICMHASSALGGCGTCSELAGRHGKVPEVNPKHENAWYKLGTEGAGTVDGKHKTNIECCIEALHINPKHANAWANLGAQGGGTVGGKHRTSIECYNEAFNLKPQHVQLVGLKARELNGACGVVVAYNLNKERYCVKLGKGEMPPPKLILIKPENLKPLKDESGSFIHTLLRA